jgi:hypothetical protein
MSSPPVEVYAVLTDGVADRTLFLNSEYATMSTGLSREAQETMGAPLRFPPAQVFIETGHGFGGTLDDIVQGSYEEIHSIEVNAELARRGQERFSTCSRVHVHHGSSPRVLPSLCDPKRETVFWLDAHYSGGNYGSDGLDSEFGQCPLLAELAIIRGVAWQVPPRIFIDDSYCFTTEQYSWVYKNCDRSQFPSLDEIQEALPSGYRLEIKRQWRPFPRALSNLRYFGRQRYLRCVHAD